MTVDRPLTVTDAADRLRRGETTSVELTRQCLTAADRLDGVLGTYLARFDDEALAAAARADAELAAGADRGPLHGIPIGVKDILAMAEGPTTAQSLVLDPAWGEGRDAPVVARLKAGGAVLTGQADHDGVRRRVSRRGQALPDPAQPVGRSHLARWIQLRQRQRGRRRHVPRRPSGPTPPAASASRPRSAGRRASCRRTGGCRSPAACRLGYSLDHIGPLARSARDCGAMLGVIAGHDPAIRPASTARCRTSPPGRAAASTVCVSVVERTNHFPDGADPAVAPCFDAAAETLAALGADVVEVTLPHYGEMATARDRHHGRRGAGLPPQRREPPRAGLLRRDPADPGPRRADQRRRLRAGATGAAARPGEAGRRVRDVDVIAAPTCAIGAPTYDQLGAHGVMSVFRLILTAYWDGAGNPVLVVPMGFTAGGLPLSLQLAGRPFEEATSGAGRGRVPIGHRLAPPGGTDRHRAARRHLSWEDIQHGRHRHRRCGRRSDGRRRHQSDGRGAGPSRRHLPVAPGSVDTLYAIDDVRYESPGTIFVAEPGFADWAS